MQHRQQQNQHLLMLQAGHRRQPVLLLEQHCCSRLVTNIVATAEVEHHAVLYPHLT
jgi:hypothetical protein